MLRTMEMAFYSPLSQIPFKPLMEIMIGIDSKSLIEGLQQKMDKLGEQKRINTAALLLLTIGP